MSRAGIERQATGATSSLQARTCGGTITPVSMQGGLSSSQLVEMSTELPEVVLKEGVSWTNITFKGQGLRLG
jgi:hypothetical protein